MKANRFPEHNEKLTILNTSPIEAEISFCYLDDSKGDCFMLDPPNMTLKPGEQQVSLSHLQPALSHCKGLPLPLADLAMSTQPQHHFLQSVLGHPKADILFCIFNVVTLFYSNAWLFA